MDALQCVLVLENGGEVNWSSGSSRFRDEACTEWSSVWYWQVPVDLKKVTALRFGDLEIPPELNNGQKISRRSAPGDFCGIL